MEVAGLQHQLGLRVECGVNFPGRRGRVLLDLEGRDGLEFALGEPFEVRPNAGQAVEPTQLELPLTGREVAGGDVAARGLQREHGIRDPAWQ